MKAFAARIAAVVGLALGSASSELLAAVTNGAVIYVAGDGSNIVDSFNRFGSPLNSFDAALTTNDGFAVGDVDGDGLDEILVAGDETHVIDIFTPAGTPIGSFNGDFTENDGFAVGDIDGDGVAEILVAGDEENFIDIFDAAGNPKGSFDGGFTADDGFATGDVDGDGDDEILVAGDGSGVIDIFDGAGNPKGSFNGGFTAGDGFATGDVDGDGDDEILVAGDENEIIDIFDGAGNPKGSFDGNFTPDDRLATGDVDGDGDDEILVAGDGTGFIDVFDAAGNKPWSFFADFTVDDGFAVDRRNSPDSDGDGLLDTWELNGVGGVDLPGFGADPLHKDLFLEIDVVAGEVLTRAQIQAMKAAFAAAPVDAAGSPNPDGEPGINLWVDTGSLSDATASEGGAGNNTCGDGLDNDMDGEVDGNDSDCLVGDDLGGGGTALARPVQCLDATFYAAKGSNFATNRTNVFRYAVVGNPLDNFNPGGSEGGAGPNTCSDGLDNDADGTTDVTDSECNCGGGRGEIGGNDFVDYNHDGGTLMHELGHNLQLLHGGFENSNCKPSYVSVMNYDNQFNISRPGGAIIDYSPPRFAGGRGVAPLPTLAENNLNEIVLDGSDPTNRFRFTNLNGVKVQSPLSQPMDWDGNGTQGDPGAFTVNINTLGFIATLPEGAGQPLNSCMDTLDNDVDGLIDAADANCNFPSACANGSVTDTLAGFDDWSNIAINFHPFGESADGALNPIADPEPTLQELIALERAFNSTDLEAAKSDAPDPVEVGAELVYSLTAVNNGPNPAGVVRVVDTLPPDVVYLSDGPPCVEGPAGTVTCEAGELLLGEWHGLQIRVDTSDVCKNGLPPPALTNAATVSNVAPFAGPDPVPGNDQAVEATTPVDTTPPTITQLSANPSQLWPPNHKMVLVTVTAVATDICDDNPVCEVTAVSSNEPVGQTSPDWEILGGLLVNLRAERLGGGPGRIYTVTVSCSDASMNVATGTVEVNVPHDLGND